MCMNKRGKKRERTIDINIPFCSSWKVWEGEERHFGFIVLDNKGYIIGAIFS